MSPIASSTVGGSMKRSAFSMSSSLMLVKMPVMSLIWRSSDMAT